MLETFTKLNPNVVMLFEIEITLRNLIVLIDLSVFR